MERSSLNLACEGDRRLERRTKSQEDGASGQETTQPKWLGYTEKSSWGKGVKPRAGETVGRGWVKSAGLGGARPL